MVARSWGAGENGQYDCQGQGITFGGDEDILELVVMLAHNECTESHQIIHFKVVKIMTFTFCEFCLN